MSPRRKKTIRPDIGHVLGRLKLAIQGLGFSLRDIEKKMKVSDGYLSRVFLGTIELKMEHILDMAKALQMAPEELMAFVYPTPREPVSPTAAQLWKRVGVVPAGAPGASQKPSQKGVLTEEDVERVVRKTLGSFFGSLGGRTGEGEPPSDPYA